MYVPQRRTGRIASINTPEPFLEHSMKLSYTAAVRLPLSLRRLFLLFF